MTKSLELTVKTNPLWAEFVAGILIDKIGCVGVVTSENYYDDEVLTKETNDRVKGYLPFVQDSLFDISEVQKIFFEEKQNLISSGIKEENIGEWAVSLLEIPDEEWAHSWKKYWHPQKISEKIVICPSWEEYNPQQDEIIIKLDPGSAFGTGTHPTTRLCVQGIEKILKENFKGMPLEQKIKMADIGTGSGILSVAGIKLGADFSVGVDNDASVISVASENAEKNDVDSKCKFYTGTAADVEGKYELVVANILAHIIIDAMPDLVNLMKLGSKLVLSGIISSKSQEVQDSAINNGLKIEEVLREESWVAIIAGL